MLLVYTCNLRLAKRVECLHGTLCIGLFAKSIHGLELPTDSSRYPGFDASWQTRWGKQAVPRRFRAVSLGICDTACRLLYQILWVAAVAGSGVESLQVVAQEK